MQTLYLLAGCHGAGKTTTAYALLPGLPDCREFELLAPAPYF